MPRPKIPRLKSRLLPRATRRRERESAVMSNKNQAAEKPEACPFCGHEDLAPSPSGKHLVCGKCGRIVMVPKPASGQG
jgi:transcription elongation factor Elf1